MASFTFLSVWWKLLFPESSTRPYREQPAPGGHQAHIPRALPLHAVSFEPGDPAHPCLSQPGLPRQSLTSSRFLRVSLSELHRVCLRAERRANPMHHSLSNQQTHTLTDHHHDKASKSLSDRRITVLRRFPCVCVFREGIEIPLPSCEPAYFPQVTVWVRQAGILIIMHLRAELWRSCDYEVSFGADLFLYSSKVWSRFPPFDISVQVVTKSWLIMSFS